MLTRNYAQPGSHSSEMHGMLGFVIKSALVGLAVFLSASMQSHATVTPYKVDDAALRKYALVSKGSLSLNQSTIKGNTALYNDSSISANNDTLNGSLSFEKGSLSLNSNVIVTNGTFRDSSISQTIASAAEFSSQLTDFKATQTLGGDLSNVTLNSTGDLNVINLRGNNVNGTITLSGDANDVFYINVWANMNVNGIALANGVLASNVYWNIVGGQSANLSGNLNGTFLAFNSNGTATSLNITNGSVNGNVIAGSMNISGMTITGISAQTAVAVAPEASSMVAMALFAVFVLGSSTSRLWKGKLLNRAA